MTPPPPAKPVGAVTAALAILRCLGRHPDALRLSDIVGEEGINSSTAFNILRTLEFEGLVAFDRRTKRYALADLAAPMLDRRDAERRLGRAMAAAAYELGATIALWRVVGDEVELVQVAESSEPMRIAFTVGRRLPMFLGAIGRLVAARGGWSADELRRHFGAVRWARTPDYAHWLADLDAARANDAATDDGFVNRGILGVAVPVELSGPLTHAVAAAMFAPAPQTDTQPIVERLRAVALAAA